MSDSFKTFVTILVRGSIDLTLGTVIGLGIDQISFFKNSSPFTDPLWLTGVRVYSESSLTLLVASEVRNFFNMDAGEDPTGGIYFIMSLARQPNFWTNMDSLVGITVQKIYSFIADSGTSSTSGTGTGTNSSGTSNSS